MIYLDDLPDSLELENIDGKIFKTLDGLNDWIENLDEIEKKYVNELRTVFKKNGFIIIDNDGFYYYLDSHPDYQKIKLYISI